MERLFERENSSSTVGRNAVVCSRASLNDVAILALLSTISAVPPAGDHSITGQRGKIKERNMIREFIDEAKYLFGGMSGKEILKEVIPVIIAFALMWALMILAFGSQPI